MAGRGVDEGAAASGIARVFPRKTSFSPDDALAFFGPPPLLALPEAREVRVSAAFTYDLPLAEWLAFQWEALGAPVSLGGPALGLPGGEFVPGMFLKPGYVITSRGCPNRCEFCAVPAREGGAVRELPVRDGWNVLDDNLLACSEGHVRDVFAMLGRQGRRPVLSGGLEAARLRPWHVGLIQAARVKRLYMAYDTPAGLEPLAEAGRLLRAGGVSAASQRAACYVLVGQAGDSFDEAETRLRQAWAAGFLPFAMLFRGVDGVVEREWARFQRDWCRPQLLARKLAGVKRDGERDGGEDARYGDFF
jgi:hypothetical protein